MWGPYNVFFDFPNVGKEEVRQKLVFLLSSRYFSIIRASSCELVKSSTNENSDNIFCLFPPRGCRVSLITEQLSFTHHILLFVSSKKEGVLEMREKPRIRPLCSPYCVTDTQPASTFPAAVCKLKISSFLFPEADCSRFTLSHFKIQIKRFALSTMSCFEWGLISSKLNHFPLKKQS